MSNISLIKYLLSKIQEDIEKPALRLL